MDVTGLRGESIDADLAQRDFTVNAIAVPLADPGAEPIDPHGGAADLEAGLLRAVSDRSFAADPLRVLRAARLGAELGFELEPGTAELARAAAGRAGEPAGERQFAELRLLVTGPDPLRGLRLMDELGATAAVLPELDRLQGVAQNPNHHLDVHGHTLEVLANLLEIERDLDRYAGDAADDVRDAARRAARGRARSPGSAALRAILHDTGKPRPARSTRAGSSRSSATTARARRSCARHARA